MLSSLLQRAVGLIARMLSFVLERVAREIRTATAAVYHDAYEAVLEESRRQWDRLKKRLTPELPEWLRFHWLGANTEQRAAAAHDRLDKILAREEQGSELTFEELHRRVHPPSPIWLALAATERLARGHLHEIFRVRSPYSAFVQNFNRLEDLPIDLVDPIVREAFTVTPSLVTMVLKSE